MSINHDVDLLKVRADLSKYKLIIEHENTLRVCEASLRQSRLALLDARIALGLQQRRVVDILTRIKSADEGVIEGVDLTQTGWPEDHRKDDFNTDDARRRLLEQHLSEADHTLRDLMREKRAIEDEVEGFMRSDSDVLRLSRLLGQTQERLQALEVSEAEQKSSCRRPGILRRWLAEKIEETHPMSRLLRLDEIRQYDLEQARRAAVASQISDLKTEAGDLTEKLEGLRAARLSAFALEEVEARQREIVEAMTEAESAIERVERRLDDLATGRDSFSRELDAQVTQRCKGRPLSEAIQAGEDALLQASLNESNADRAADAILYQRLQALLPIHAKAVSTLEQEEQAYLKALRTYRSALRQVRAPPKGT